jgi:hypothetical protein
VPFTASHPAAVLPLVRLGLVPSALVIGSMAPDLPYFVPSPLGAGTTHSAHGVVTVDVLLGLLLYAGWHGLLAPGAVALAPAGLRRRLPVGALPAGWWRPGSLRAALLLLVSVAVGALTHVVWDSFTHPARWGARHVAWLSSQHGSVMGYEWAQYASGLFGAVVLAAWTVLWWRRTPVRAQEQPQALLAGRTTSLVAGAVVAGAGVVGALLGGLGPLLDGGGPQLHRAAFRAVTRGGLAAGVAAVLAAIAVLLMSRKAGPR